VLLVGATAYIHSRATFPSHLPSLFVMLTTTHLSPISLAKVHCDTAFCKTYVGVQVDIFVSYTARHDPFDS
jgi:hypothetical protein